MEQGAVSNKALGTRHRGEVLAYAQCWDGDSLEILSACRISSIQPYVKVFNLQVLEVQTGIEGAGWIS